MSEQDLEKKIKIYSQVAKENPNVDVGLLMMNALQNESSKKAAGKSYHWPYLISLGIPPLGLLFALKYYIDGSESDKRAGRICIILTIVAILAVYLFGKMLFSGSGSSIQQIQQIQLKDIQQLTQ